MGAVDDRFNASAACHLADLLDGENLPRCISHMAEENHPRAGRDRPLEPVVEVVQIGDGQIEWDCFQDDSLPPLPLLPGEEHAWIVLIGGQDLVARL